MDLHQSLDAIQDAQEREWAELEAFMKPNDQKDLFVSVKTLIISSGLAILNFQQIF